MTAFSLPGRCAATVLMLAAALGCGGTKGPAPIPVVEPTRLTVGCPDEVTDTIIQRYGQTWAKKRNVRLNIVRAPAGAALPEVDLAVVPTASMPRGAAAGAIRILPETTAAPGETYRWQDLLPLYKNKLLVWDGKACALPLLGSATVCYYRDDLFADPAHQAAFRAKHSRPLAAPTTWEEYAEIAEFFQNRAGMGAATLPPLSASAAELDQLFYTIAASYDRRAVREDEPRKPGNAELFSFHYDLDTVEPRLAAPAFVHALKLLQRLQACRPSEPASVPAEAFRDGKAVLGIGAPAWMDCLQKPESKVRNKFAVCRVPGSDFVFDYKDGKKRPIKGNYIPYVGSAGWLGVVPTTARHPDVAFDLLAYLSGAATSAEIVIEPAWGGGAFRRDHLTGNAWESFGLGPERTRGLVEALRSQLTPNCINPAVRLRIPDEAEHVQAFTDILRGSLSRGDANPTDTLQAAARRWKELDAEKPLAERRKLYRLSLGLSAEGGK